MADSTKVRLVRCPKCENLLPELADYSVYQCGGCGAVLRAKNKNRDTDASSQKSDEVTVTTVTAELQSTLEKGVAELCVTSDVDFKPNAGSLSCIEKNDNVDSEKCRNQSVSTSGKLVVEDDIDMSISRDNLGASLGRELGNTSRSWRSGQMSDWEPVEKDETAGLRRISRTEVEGVRFSTSNYPDEGPSNNNLDHSDTHGETLRNHKDRDGPNRVPHLEKDRAELLRKLDELKEQLSRSYDVADKPKEKIPLNARVAPSDPYTSSDAWFPGASPMPDRTSMQFLTPDKHATRPPYFHHQSDPFSYSNSHDMAVHNFHPSMHKSNHIPGFGDPFGLKRAPHQLSGQYEQPPRQYFSRNHFDPNPDPFDPYTTNPTFHHPSCSCFHCFERHQGVSVQVPHSSFSNKRFPDVSNNPMFYQHENPGSFGPHMHNSRASVPPPVNFRGPQSHARWPSDLNAEMYGFVRSRPRRVVLTGGSRCCHPIVGGAPFFTCFNCFELLQVPKKVLVGRNQQKIRCGACSTFINFTVVNKKLVISVNTQARRIPRAFDDSSTEIIKDNASYSHGHMGRINANFSSDDYDNSGYDFQTIDSEPIPYLTGQGLNSMKHQEMNSFHTSSLSTSEDENSPDALVTPREVINNVQEPIQASLSPPPAGSPLQQHFDFSSSNNTVNRLGRGNRSSRSDQEKVMNSKGSTRQNSMKEASLATEIEVPFHEYANTGVSQDSGDANREDSQLKINKGGDSFFANIIKKSFKDFAKSNHDERGRSNVSVNGHLIPDRLVKKAEKLVGPIHPGKYWYDVRAGFWGAIGGPCLGIVPPYIEEFDFPVPEDCAGGDTGVFVNGRELHRKDLDLLAGRGLPIDRDRSYIIEISGRVLDEDTGEELDSLGKLAPTVEKVKHGFGMKIPKAAE